MSTFIFRGTTAAYTRVLIVLASGVILSACETTPRHTQSTQPDITIVTDTETLVESGDGENARATGPQGDPIISARNKINEARYLSGPGKAKKQLDAAQLLMDSGRTLSASNILSEISQTFLSGEDQPIYRILLATADYRDANYNSAWQQVQRINLQNIGGRDDLQKYWRLRGFLEYRLNRLADSLSSLVNRERYLEDPLALSQNQEQIRLITDNLSAAQIEDIKVNVVNPEVLNRLIDTYTPPTNVQFNTATPHTLRTPTWGPNAPRNIALLLPISSRFSSFALAVEKGFREAQHDDPSPLKPEIHLIDIGADLTQIASYYQSAVASGIDFIVGPLGRDAASHVSGIATGSTLTSTIPAWTPTWIPTLMLGTPDNPGYHPSLNLTHFDFSPENEAYAVARKMFQDGHRSVAVLRSSQNWSNRYFDSFHKHWSNLGGTVRQAQIYFDDTVDFSREIRNLLGIDLSEQRKEMLQSILGLNISFQPRRDRSLDAVLLLARPEVGQLLRPQLSFHQGHDLDVYASSHIYSEDTDLANNRDLDDTVFPIITSALETKNNTTLHALGADAYLLVSALSQNVLSKNTDNSVSFTGSSGYITLNENGAITRTPSWARFEQGALTAAIETEQTPIKPLPPASTENNYFNRITSREDRQTTP